MLPIFRQIPLRFRLPSFRLPSTYCIISFGLPDGLFVWLFAGESVCMCVCAFEYSIFRVVILKFLVSYLFFHACLLTYPLYGVDLEFCCWAL